MIGLIINNTEKEEIIHLLKKEMDEMIDDLKDPNIEQIVKTVMKERYKIIFNLFKRVVPHHECIKYMLKDK